jgi:hypothetical protein
VYPATESARLGRRTLTFKSDPIQVFSESVVAMQNLDYMPDRVLNEPPIAVPFGASPLGDGPEIGAYWKCFLEDGTSFVSSFASLISLIEGASLRPTQTYQEQVLLGKAKIKSGPLAAMYSEGNSQTTAAPITIEKYATPISSQPVPGDFYVAKLKGGKKLIIDQDGFDSITGGGYIPA